MTIESIGYDVCNQDPFNLDIKIKRSIGDSDYIEIGASASCQTCGCSISANGCASCGCSGGSCPTCNTACYC